MTNLLSLVAKTYDAVSSTASTVAHPIRSAQSAIRDYLAKKAVAAVVEIAGAAVAKELAARVQVEKRVSLEMRVPPKARSLVLNKDALSLIEGLVNDGLAAPLGVVGLRLVALALAPSTDGSQLVIDALFKLQSTAEPALVTKPAAA